MSGSLLPYHLRQNKAIERNIFIELLSKLAFALPINKYEYISFGGPFLEDFKVVHNNIGIKQMISLESDERVLSRQKFNLPLKCIRLFHKNSEEFIESYPFDKPTIIWLDYTDPEKIANYLDEIILLVSTKLKRGDIVKITLNAKVGYYGEIYNTPIEKDLHEERLHKLKEVLGKYLPSDISSDLMTNKNFPIALHRILKLAFDKGMQGRKGVFLQPLSSFAYADGQQMFTFTGIILNEGEKNALLDLTGIKSWKLNSVAHDTPIFIDVPELSMKERFFIDKLIPTHYPKTIHKKLKFLIAKSDDKSLERVSDYVKYSKQYPFFSKIIP